MWANLGDVVNIKVSYMGNYPQKQPKNTTKGAETTVFGVLSQFAHIRAWSRYPYSQFLVKKGLDNTEKRAKKSC